MTITLIIGTAAFTIGFAHFLDDATAAVCMTLGMVTVIGTAIAWLII